MDIDELTKEYDAWENKKHNITNKEYYVLKNNLDKTVKCLKFLLYIQGILLGMVLAILIKT